MIDGSDLLVWQENFGAGPGKLQSDGDANGDGHVDGADFIAWQRSYTGPPSVSARVPEPAGVALACLAIVFAAAGRQLRRRV